MRVEFDAGAQIVSVGNDGRVYATTDSGEPQYLETAPTLGAAHANPGFEDETAGVVDDWDFTWYTGTLPTISSETTLVYSGARSLKVQIPSGGGEQIVLSDTFAVEPGGSVPFSVFATKTVGSPRIQLGLLTGASGTPVFLDPANYTNNENAEQSIGAGWGMFQRNADVPVAHDLARLFFRLGPATTEACTVYLDLTASQVIAPREYESGWIALPYSANWSDAGFGWAGGEYRRKGDSLMLRGLVARSTSASGADAVIATLPTGFRPSTNRLVADSYLSSASLPTPSQIYVNSAGEIVTHASIPFGAFVALERTLPL